MPDPTLPFIMHASESPLLVKISIGREAMKRSGASKAFIAANMIQAAALNCSVILRAGEPPQHDKKRSPKSGLNLTKTSNQGFFKGALTKEERFSRINSARIPRPHDPRDAAHLALNPTDLNYQFCMQLDINMLDILKEIAPGGDLEVLNYEPTQHLLFLIYKEGCGPLEGFQGQFVIDFSKGLTLPQFYSRDWNHPQEHPDWDPEQHIIKKPSELSALPDELYPVLFNQTFYLSYSESQGEINAQNPIKKAEVFANRLSSASEFKEAMGHEHPFYDAVKHCTSLGKILSYLKLNHPKDACQVILEVYETSGRIVAGDWDGLMLGYPSTLEAKYSEVINVFAPGSEGVENQQRLLDLTGEYFLSLKEKAALQRDKQYPLSAFEQKILSMQNVFDVISDFALAQAGCITAHELLFQQICNDAYRDRMSTHYGEKQELVLLQKVMDILLSQVGQRMISSKDLRHFIRKILQREMMAQSKSIQEGLLNKYIEHVLQHFILARHIKHTHYELPHLQFDMNVQDLYQHGFDMRNPYGSNLEGAWLFISNEGCVFYGETQEALIELLLDGNFLEQNYFDLHPDVDLSKGWDKIIARQLENGQPISLQLLERYQAHLRALSPSRDYSADIFEQISMTDLPNATARCIIKDEITACSLSI